MDSLTRLVDISAPLAAVTAHLIKLQNILGITLLPLLYAYSISWN